VVIMISTTKWYLPAIRSLFSMTPVDSKRVVRMSYK
jgi:hypothetical protein